MHDMFYFTDIHGQSWLYNEIIKYCQTDPEATIIFGGDACDRGPHGYKIMKDLLQNPQIIYLKGNHEDLFVKAAYEILGAHSATDIQYEYIHNIHDRDEAAGIIIDMQDNYYKHTALHVYNGGLNTLIDWMLDGADEDFVSRIESLPICFQYKNIDFCHAGGTVKTFDKVYTAEYNGKNPDYNSVKRCIWDRDCWHIGWANDRICIHGHTPSIFLPAKFYGSSDKSEANARPAAWHGMYQDQYNGLKIDMDTGATFTGRAYVLNLHTFYVTGFQDFDIDFPDKKTHKITQFANYKIK